MTVFDSSSMRLYWKHDSAGRLVFIAWLIKAVYPVSCNTYTAKQHTWLAHLSAAWEMCLCTTIDMTTYFERVSSPDWSE